MKRIRKFEKPCGRFSNHSKLYVYCTSYYLQIIAFFITLFTGKEIRYAFYYSKKQDGICQGYDDKELDPLFKGQRYSECSELKNGFNNWEDSKLLGIGNDTDITFIFYSHAQTIH